MQNNHINEEFERAVRKGYLEIVKALLSAGADANFSIGRESDTLLHITHSVEITKELLLGGAKVNVTNKYGITPLRSAIELGKNLELVGELLKHGADVNRTDIRGETPLSRAVKRYSDKREVIKELLLNNKIDIDIRNHELGWHNANCIDMDVHDLECTKLLIKFTLIMNFNKDYKKIIDLSPLNEYNNYSKLSSYLDGCVCEILQMKTDEIIDSLPLYEFVTNSCNVQVLRNNQLSVRLAKIDLRYPIYNDIILDKVKPFLERADLLNMLSKIPFYTKLDVADQDIKGKKIILDYYSTYNITDYLSNDDLLNVILVFGDSHKFTFQPLSSLNNLVEPGTGLDETSVKTGKWCMSKKEEVEQMYNISNKILEGVAIFLEKAKLRSVTLHLDTIVFYSRNNRNEEAVLETKQWINLPWSLSAVWKRLSKWGIARIYS
ncbi:hypothetical protein FQA39_LY02858 [Lamprigera yunnana]|nr:hypothetical protein FQA39_LY02858 [Lamprigera yunnana]